MSGPALLRRDTLAVLAVAPQSTGQRVLHISSTKPATITNYVLRLWPPICPQTPSDRWQVSCAYWPPAF